MSFVKLNQKGFGHVGLVALVVVVLAAIGFAGYKVMNAQTAQPKSSQSTQVAKSSDATVPAVIKTQADLNTVSNVLDTTGSQLNSSFDTSALDASVDSML